MDGTVGTWARLTPLSLRGYRRAWLRADVIAGVTLAAVAIPETMGYTSIAQTPIVTGLYTVIFPTIAFALLGSSRLLVVGADSATAAILAAGLAGLGVAGLTPYSQQWLAYSSLIALVCGVMLAVARVLRLGFLGDFLSASVLIGFLTGVGISVLSGQIPAMLGIPKSGGNWFEQQWHVLTSLPDASLTTVAFAVGALVVILGFRLLLPKVPGSIIAVVLAIAVSAAVDAGTHGVALVGSVPGGFPPIGLPKGMTWPDTAHVVGIAFSCFVLIIAQSAATSRSFAMRNGERVDVNRDIVGLSAANLAAGVTGTFVVNGSPTKTQILDEQKGRTQLANITMSAIVLVIVLFASAVLKDMPEAVLAAIVFLIGISLVDVAGLKRIWRQQRGEFVIAAITGVCVFAVGVEQGILVAVTLSLLNLVRRQYRPSDFVVGVNKDGTPTYQPARPGVQSLPGLVVFRYDADLFYANANRFVDDVQALLVQTPDPCRWLVLDASSIDDVDYSAAISLATLIDFVRAQGTRFVIAAADSRLVATLDGFGLIERIGTVNMHPTVADAVAAFRRSEPAPR